MRGTTRTTTAALAAFLTGAAGTALSGPATAADVVGCGAVIDSEVVLAADLVCRRSPVGLTLLDGASLDLNGFRIVGGGSGTALLLHGVGNARVHGGGTIVGWGAAARNQSEVYDQLGTVTFEDITFRRNGYGIALDGMSGGAPRVDVVSSRFVDNGGGIGGSLVFFSVTSSRFTGGGSAVDLFVGGRATVTDTVIADHTYGLVCNEAGCAVESSTIRDTDTAITSWYRTFISVHDSVIARNGTGIDTASDLPVELIDNDFRDNGTAVHLRDTGGTLVGNRFLRNEVGFSMPDDHPAAHLEGNEFRRNGDGILDVADSSGLKDNVAVNNERWGIHAPGAVDLGGNTARGNGNEPLCVGVVCARTGPRS